MATVVTPNSTLIASADTTTGFTGTSGQLDIEIFKQGSGSFTYQTSKNGTGNCVYTLPSVFNITAIPNPHLYWTMRCDVFPFCELFALPASSGLHVKLTDSVGGIIEFAVAGRDTWDGGWKTFVVDLHNTSNVFASTGLDYSLLNSIEFITDNSNSGNIRIIDNSWVDNIIIGSGLTTSNTLAYDFESIYLIDSNVNNYYRVVTSIDGVYFVNGELILSDNFDSTNDVVIYPAGITSNSFYSITTTGTGIVKFTGFVCKYNKFYDPFSPAVIFDVSNISMVLNMTSSSLINIGIINLYSGFVKTSAFNGCGEITISGDISLEGNKFEFGQTTTIQPLSGATLISNVYTQTQTPTISPAIVMCDNLDDIIDCSFTQGPVLHSAIKLTSLGSGTMQWDNTLSGFNPIDGNSDCAIYVAVASGTLTINVGAGYSTPSIKTDGAVVSVVSGQVTATFKVVDIDTGLPIQDAMSYIQAATTTSDYTIDDVILQGLTDINGEISTTIGLSAPQPIKGRIRSATTTPFYKTGKVSATINNISGLDLTTQMITDE